MKTSRAVMQPTPLFPSTLPIAILSTAHLPEDFGRAAAKPGFTCPKLVACTAAGLILWTHMGAAEGSLPIEVCAILEYAERAGLAYVYFDRDGPRSPHFTVFDW